MRVHFICNGNVYRSRMAAAYLISLKTSLEVISSGILADEHQAQNDPVGIQFTDNFLCERGVAPLLSRHPIQLTQELLDSGDVTVLMSRVVQNNIAAAGLSLPSNTRVWDIADLSEQSGPSEKRLELQPYTVQIFAIIRRNIDDLVEELQLGQYG